jgi:hypothetical protein
MNRAGTPPPGAASRRIAIGCVVAFLAYLLPGGSYAVWAVTHPGPKSAVFFTLLPWFILAPLLSIAVIPLLRLVAKEWRALPLGLAAATLGGGGAILLLSAFGYHGLPN